MIESLSIAVHAFVSRVSMSFSVDETLLPRYVNLSTSLKFVTWYSPKRNIPVGRGKKGKILTAFKCVSINAASNIEQVLEAAPLKATAVRSLTHPHHENYLT